MILSFSKEYLCWHLTGSCAGNLFNCIITLFQLVIEMILGLAAIFGMSSLFLISSHSSKSQSKAWSIYQNPYLGLLATVWSFLSQSLAFFIKIIWSQSFRRKQTPNPRLTSMCVSLLLDLDSIILHYMVKFSVLSNTFPKKNIFTIFSCFQQVACSI